MINEFQTIIDNLVRWGESCNNLRAAVIIGSQARQNRHADRYSDLDIILVADEADYFLSSDDWLKNIGSFYVSFVENAIYGAKERRILFDGALDVDFLILPYNIINSIGREAAVILGRGYRILIDKIGLSNILTPLVSTKKPYRPLTEYDFINLVNDFWYHSVWTAKKLKRGELWTAKFCVDSYMKRKLLSIIEHHAHVTHGLEHDTWHSGRFIEEWA